MIYDCFTFFNELDLLEIRLNVLNSVVDRFVIVEATKTYSGLPKPLYFRQSLPLFQAFKGKIVHVIVDSYDAVEKFVRTSPDGKRLEAWAYETFQRQNISRGLQNVKDDDVIIVSDLDEIPSAEAVRMAASCARDGKLRLIKLSHRSYYLNFCNFTSPYWSEGPMVVSGKTYRDEATYRRSYTKDDSSVRALCPFPSPQLLRKLVPDELVWMGGWHFSWMGGTAAVIKKLKSFAHTEYADDEFCNEDRIRRIIAHNGDLLGFGDCFLGVRPEKCLPQYVLDNRERFKNLIFEVDICYQLRTIWPRVKAYAFLWARKVTSERMKRAYWKVRALWREDIRRRPAYVQNVGCH